MLLSIDTCAQLEMIHNALRFAAFSPLVDDAGCVAIFGADRSDLREFLEEFNVAVDPNYKNGSYEAAFRAQQAAK